MPNEKLKSIASTDNIMNYHMAFTRARIDFMVLHDVIKDADVDRLIVITKRLIPLFVGLTSFKSKYAIELINFIT